MFCDQFFGKRPGGAKFQDPDSAFRLQFTNAFDAIRGGGAAGDYQEFGFLRARVGVEGRSLENLPRFFELFVQGRVEDRKRAGGEPAFSRVEHVPGFREDRLGLSLSGQLSCHDVASRIRDPSHPANESQKIYGLRHLVGPLDHLLCLLGARRLHQGVVDPLGYRSRVLFVVARPPSRVVGDENDHARGADSRHVEVDDEVRGHVGPVLLHHAKGAEPGERGARGHLDGHFFVCGPLHVDVDRCGCFRKCRNHFRRRAPGISRGHCDTRFENAARHGLVTHEKGGRPGFQCCDICCHLFPPGVLRIKRFATWTKCLRPVPAGRQDAGGLPGCRFSPRFFRLRPSFF